MGTSHGKVVIRILSIIDCVQAISIVHIVVYGIVIRLNDPIALTILRIKLRHLV